MTDNSSQFDQIVTQYLHAVEQGEAPDREQLFEQHPELADELRAFFANQDGAEAVSGQEAATLPPSRPDSDNATLPPRDSLSEDATVPPASRDEATIPPSAPTDSPAVGTRVRYFGDYELLQEIARGGMGVVYKARQTKLNRIVALKMILAGQLASEEDVQRFHAEAEAAANLDHPGIVPIYEIGEHEGQHYFSMGFVEGESLADKLRDGPLPPKEAAELHAARTGFGENR